MNVVFWSPVAGRCHTSSSMLAFATYISLSTEYKCCILQANIGSRGAQSAFITEEGETSVKKVTGGFGLDAILMVTNGKVGSDVNIKDNALTIRPNLDFFVNSTDPRTKTVQETLIRNYDSILEQLARHYDIAFIDGGSGYSEASSVILENADVIVVCFSQNVDVTREFFSIADFSEKKCIYLITNFDNKVQYASSKIRNQYKKAKKAVFASMPHNPAFANSINDGTLLKWETIGYDTQRSSGSKLMTSLGFGQNESDQTFFVALEDFSKKFFKVIGGLDT